MNKKSVKPPAPAAKKKKKGHPFYSPEVWATIRALYESGKFKSRDELHKHCTKILPAVPSVSAIAHFIAENGVSKKTLAGVIENKKRERYVDLFSRLGADDEECAKLVVKGMHAADDIRKEIQVIIDRMASKMEDEGATAEMLQGLEEVVTKLQPYFSNMAVALKYAQERFKLCGDYQAVKIKKIDDDGGSGGSSGKGEEELTIDEINKEIERMEKARTL